MIGERIRRARLLRGMSLQGLADALGDISKQALSKFETGRDVPNSARLLQLAKILELKAEYFFRPVEVRLERVEFRKKTRLTKKDREAIVEQTRDHLERYLILESLFEVADAERRGFAAHSIQVSDPQDAEEAAEKLRRKWNIGFDAIENLTELLEDKGIKVVELDAPESFDGLSAWVDEKHPVIILNRNKAGERQRFTVAHELGHLVMDMAKGADEEKLCHRFAGAFIFPKECVLRELGEHRKQVSWQELILLKEKYGLSLAAMLSRGRDLGIFPPSVVTSAIITMKQQGLWKKEPHELKREQPTRFDRLLYHSLAEGLISLPKAAELMVVPVEELEYKIEHQMDT